LAEHVLGSGVDVCKNLNRHPRVADQGRDSLNNFPVLVLLFLGAQCVAGLDPFLNFRILRNQAWIRGLAVNKSEQILNSQCFLRIPTIHEDLRFRLVCQHVPDLQNKYESLPATFA
jgi:hypothetical protein